MSEDLFNNGYDVRLRPYALESIVFSETIPADLAEETVEEVEIVISEVCRSRWIFDESLQSYLRWEEEGDGLPSYVPSRDLLAPDSQIRAENLLILFSDYVVYDAMLHDVRIHYADGMMPAAFFRNGQMVSGYWSGMEAEQPLRFYTENLIEYPLVPGKSWILFVTEDSVLKQISAGSWRLEFTIP
jgi:hypothetical protein